MKIQNKSISSLMKKGNKGIALLVALGTMIAILIIASLSVYLIVRGLNVTAGQTRYETAFEAAVATLEIGKSKVDSLNLWFDAPPTKVDTLHLGPFACSLYARRTSSKAIVMSGTAIKFARAILGPGSTAGTTGSSFHTYYVAVTAIGRGGEDVALEILDRRSVQP